MNENEMISYLKDCFAPTQSSWQERLEMGIGDDAACWQESLSGLSLVSTDTLMDRVHFDALLHRPYLIGRKALAVSISDIAAMAGTPTFALINLTVPRDSNFAFVKELANGVKDLALRFEVAIVGGDFTSWDGPLVVTTTLHGDVHPTRKVARRSCGAAGERVYVTGELGASYETGHHLDFEPRVRVAQHLVSHYRVGAMMDISDGIGSDLRRLCAASQVGCRVDSNNLPLRAPLEPGQWQRGLLDGEDFELLFTLSNRDGNKLEQEGLPDGTRVTQIGVLTEVPGFAVKVGDNNWTPFHEEGYNHKISDS